MKIVNVSALLSSCRKKRRRGSKGESFIPISSHSRLFFLFYFHGYVVIKRVAI